MQDSDFLKSGHEFCLVCLAAVNFKSGFASPSVTCPNGIVTGLLGGPHETNDLQTMRDRTLIGVVAGVHLLA